jgi:hypothetical protein
LASPVARQVIPLAWRHHRSRSPSCALRARHGPRRPPLRPHTDTWDTYFGGQRHSAGTRSAGRRGGPTDARASCRSERGPLFSNQDIGQSLDLGYEVVTTDQMLDAGSRPSPGASSTSSAAAWSSCPSTWTSSTPSSPWPDAGGRRPLGARHPQADPRASRADRPGPTSR